MSDEFDHLAPPCARHLNRRQALAITAMMLSTGAVAQRDWPDRPVRMIVPNGGGSGSDLMARTFGNSLASALHQPFVIDNKPGANGILAIESLLQQPSDGYTLGFLSSSYTVISQALQPKLPFNILTDMVPIVQIGAGGIHLVASPDFPAKTLADFVTLMRANPGKYNYGSWGIGSTGHLMMEWLKSTAGIDLRHIPYKTVPQIYQDLQSGNLAIAWVDASSSVALLQSGKLKGLATSGSRRGPAVPNLPTLTEQGYRFDLDAWFGIFARRGIPDKAVTLINEHVRAALKDGNMQAKLAQLNLGETPQRAPAAFAQVVQSDLQGWKAIAKANHIVLD